MTTSRRSIAATLIPLVWLAWASAAPAQETPQTESASVDESPVSESIDVREAPDDDEIQARLQSILDATTWFEFVDVQVESGVVYLTGTATAEEHRNWATELVRNTEGAVAVVNRLTIAETSPWDLSPTFEQIRLLAAGAFRALPLVLIGAILLVVTWLASRFTLRAAKFALRRQVPSALLRDVTARALSVLVFVLGVYIVLRISGLTGLAVTIIGGTGLLGLAIGFAFRDIAENFLASILISIQKPFRMGDLIELDGHVGYVQRVNTRATLIMTRDGNHVQIPNSIAYKQTIMNYTGQSAESRHVRRRNRL